MTSSLLTVGTARRFTRNTVRDIDLLRRPLLLKRMPDHQEARAEVRGWRTLRSHFPLPHLYGHVRVPGSAFLIYERWGVPGEPATLLDLINEADDAGVAGYLDVLTATYRQVMFETARMTLPQGLVGKLYHHRAAPGGRLSEYYADRSFEVGGISVEELASYEFIINGRTRRVDWYGTLAWLATWATAPLLHWSAITQGDPTDVNLAVPFALFDYGTAGHNAVCGEFANFCWYTGFLGGYLVPRMNPAAFTSSPLTFEFVHRNAPVAQALTADHTARRLKVDLTWRPTPARRAANRLYWDNLVLPVWMRLDGRREQLAAALRPYLALRMIGVFNLAHLEPLDRLAVFACLAECLAEDFDAERLLTEGLT